MVTSVLYLLSMHRLLSLSCGSLQPSHLNALQENGVKTGEFVSF